jgi:hypothetical protein
MPDQSDAPATPPPPPSDGEPDVEPTRPEAQGVPDASPDPMDLEAARLLANEARPTLHAQGFDDEQIDAWATTYTARFGSGDTDRFLAWIETEQSR